MGEAKDVVADVLAAHAGRVSRADESAERGARDRRGFGAHLLERFNDRDVSEPPRAAAAERECKAFHAK